jgi:hypothetical protein
MKANLFNSVQVKHTKSNRFDLTHDVKMSFRMGELVPSCIMDCVPGDKITISTENLLRFSPLISPVMHRIKVTTHFFFVPNRILWDDWEEWITGNLEVQPPITAPHNSGSDEWTCAEGSLADYLGVPVFVWDASIVMPELSAFPFAAFAKIWYEYYRDQNLQDPSTDPLASVMDNMQSLADGYNWLNGISPNPETTEQIFIKRPPRRAWNHDYFTASLPFAQKGTALQVPLGSFALEYDHTGGGTIIRNSSTGVAVASSTALRFTNAGGMFYAGDPTAGGTQVDADITAHTKVVPNSTQEGVTITDLRRAFRLQEWLELNARGGTRYKESIKAHFGVNSSDGRLQRPEYLGGSVQNMVISEVLATAENETSGVPVGDLAGHGISAGAGKQFSYYCEEHGWIIGIINVQPITAYQQGLAKQWSRNDRLDYYWPSFQHIGEQEVKLRELYWEDIDDQEETFGYVPRYAEYKYIPNRVAGEFRSSLSFWHLGRIFDAKPVLNSEFISANPRTDIFAVEEEVDHIYAHILNRISAVRKMAVYGNPMM